MKAINWTVTAMLLRTLLILGASTFVGAIVLPVGVDGTLPMTWAAWKPILAVAASAAAVAEFLWIRAHLSQAAQALGLPAIPAAAQAATNAAKTAIVLLGLGMLVRGETACANPAQAANDVAIGLQGAACVLNVYSTDTAAGQTSFIAIVADSVAQCGKYGITEAGATGLLQAHQQAEMKEGFVPKAPAPAAPAASAH